ncbi:MAG: signal peptidase I [Patescibacteria group bacterium]|nr:signal peptidase I [Patescibacteria group bacterium]
MPEDMFGFLHGDEDHKATPKKSVPRRSTWLTIFVGTVIFIYDVFKTVSTVLGVAFLIRFFLIQPFYVSGPSMEPNFHNNQYIIVDQVSYRFSAPDRGNVVVFKWPQNIAVSFIKRVIGLPGETVEIKDGKVYIYNNENPGGTLLDESYLQGVATPTDTRRKLGKNEYFVMGDNRNNSSDSRSWGPVPRNLIVGKVWVVVYPFSDFHTISTPSYGRSL